MKPGTSSRVKRAGYILLISSATLLFITTSGLASLYLFIGNIDAHQSTETFFQAAGSVTFILAVISIIWGRGNNEDMSLSNRLLLPHYFKYVGCIYLALTILYSTTNFYRHLRTTNIKWHRGIILSSDEKGLSTEQKKIYDGLKDGAKLEHSSTITITPLTLILPVGLLFLAFAKERVEDELVSKYRTQSLQLAILLLFFLILYQKFYVPEVKTIILTGKKGIAYFDITPREWRADVLINVILIFSIVRMEYLLRLKPLFTKNAGV